MKICIIHNEYATFTGEEAAVQSQNKLLQTNGHEVINFTRSSEEISKLRFGKTRAFFSGIYSFSSKKTTRGLLSKHKPDIVHVHNLFPLISPSILGECRKNNVPVVMTVHNYRLFCPIGLYMVNGQICERCDNGEYWCILKNCTGSLAKSIGYALRNFVARKLRLFKDNVSIYICLTNFQKQRLIAEGFPPDRIVVIPNMVTTDKRTLQNATGNFVGYVGRISPEKGVNSLLQAAAKCTDIPFKAAGSYTRMSNLPRQAPQNFEFLGHLNKNQIDRFYNNSRLIVLPSICYEGFPSVLIEAMANQKPVICSRIGGLQEIVQDGVSGLLFEPGNAHDLTEKIRFLWDRPELCRQMGHQAQQKALRQYSPQKYYEQLMSVYKKAVQLSAGGTQ